MSDQPRATRDPELTWTLSENDKGENPSRPDFRGQITVKGVKYWLSGWLKEGKNGQFISGSAKVAEDKPQSTTQKPSPGSFLSRSSNVGPRRQEPKPEDDGDVPF